MILTDFESFCETNGSFMQSARWAEVKSGWEREYIIAKDASGKTVGTMLVLIKRIPYIGRSMLYAPRGPVCDMHDKTVLNAILAQVKQIAQKYRAYTLKLDPLIDVSDIEAIENLKALGFRYHPEKVGYDTVQCRENYRLDIADKSAQEVFDHFKSKWRYNIRLSQRKGVTCGIFGEEKLDDFVGLMKETSERDGFQMRSKEYYRRILQSFPDHSGLCMCYYGDCPLSGALYMEYGGTMSYVYGCSSNRLRNYMPNYLMQWTMIEHACHSGCKVYDFCGIPYWYDEKHPNYGVYQFKRGFNGYVKTYAGEFDYCFRPVTDFVARIAMRLHTKF